MRENPPHPCNTRRDLVGVCRACRITILKEEIQDVQCRLCASLHDSISLHRTDKDFSDACNNVHCRKIEKKKQSDRFQVFASKDEMSNNKVDVDLVLIFFFLNIVSG